MLGTAAAVSGGRNAAAAPTPSGGVLTSYGTLKVKGDCASDGRKRGSGLRAVPSLEHWQPALATGVGAGAGTVPRPSPEPFSHTPWSAGTTFARTTDTPTIGLESGSVSIVQEMHSGN